MGRNLHPVVISFLFLGACAPEGPSTYIDFNIPPDSECTYSAGTGNTIEYLPLGLYDIAANGDPDETNAGMCENSYVLALRVNSQLRPGFDMEMGRSEPNVLQITRAEVRLMDQQQRTLVFDAVDPPLPNPFLVNTNLSLPPTDNEEPTSGLAFVEAIPTAYAPNLRELVNDQILVEVKLFGTTLGDVDVDFTPYLYPVRICEGCLTRCLKGGGSSAPIDLDALDEDVCQDNAGYDGRLCLDPTC